MKTATKPSKNGELKKTDSPKNEVVKAISKVDEILNPTADARIKKMETFRILADKHKFLSSKNDELQKFIAASDGTKERIVLKNAQGFSLEVSNSNVIEKVVYVIKEELQRITDHSEKEILEFSL